MNAGFKKAEENLPFSPYHDALDEADMMWAFASAAG